MTKLVHLEAIRGVASLEVVIAHYAVAFYPATLLGDAYRSHEPWEKLFTTTPLALLFAGHFSVCIFFVLSGFVLSRPYFGESARDTDHLLAALVKRPFRLGGLVLFTVTASYCIFQLGGYFNAAASEHSFSNPWFSTKFPKDTFASQPFLLQVTTGLFQTSRYNPPLWTLGIELTGSFLTYIFLLLFRRSTLRAAAYVYGLIYFRDTLFQGFFIGIILADLSRNKAETLAKWSRPIFSWPLLLIGLACASYPKNVPPAELEQTIYGAFPALPGVGGGYAMLGAAAVFSAVLLNPWLQRMLSGSLPAFLGRISYAVYASHFLVLASFSSWLFLRLYPSLSYDQSCAIMFLVSLALLAGLGYLLTKYVDEPVTRAADRIGRLWLQSTEKRPPASAMSFRAEV